MAKTTNTSSSEPPELPEYLKPAEQNNPESPVIDVGKSEAAGLVPALPNTGTNVVASDSENVAPPAPETDSANAEPEYTIVNKIGDFVQAVFVGWGYVPNMPTYFPSIWSVAIPVDKAGKRVPHLDEWGEPINPMSHPDFSHLLTINMKPGDIVSVPAYDLVLYQRAVHSGQFAYAENAELVQEMYKKGAPGNAVKRELLKKNAAAFLKPATPKNDAAASVMGYDKTDKGKYVAPASKTPSNG